MAAGFPQEGDVVLEQVASEEESFRVVQLIENLEHPWSPAWLPDGYLYLLTDERNGGLYRLEPL